MSWIKMNGSQLIDLIIKAYTMKAHKSGHIYSSNKGQQGQLINCRMWWLIVQKHTFAYILNMSTSHIK